MNVMLQSPPVELATAVEVCVEMTVAPLRTDQLQLIVSLELVMADVAVMALLGAIVEAERPIAPALSADGVGDGFVPGT